MHATWKSVDCPKCGAVKGAACVILKRSPGRMPGDERPYPHPERRDATMALNRKINAQMDPSA